MKNKFYNIEGRFYLEEAILELKKYNVETFFINAPSVKIKDKWYVVGTFVFLGSNHFVEEVLTYKKDKRNIKLYIYDIQNASNSFFYIRCFVLQINKRIKL